MKPARFGLVLLLIIVVATACGLGTGGHSRPCVIVIVMDTTRADRCSLYGYARPTTPFLESLASEATVFTDAWSPSCWTGPAHASLFTGLRPEHHGFLGGLRFYLDDGPTTLAEALGRQGYDTACLTRNPTVSEECGLSRGFRVFECIQDPIDRPGLSRGRTTARALAFVRACRSQPRPFFLFVNHWDPHVPYDPPAEEAAGFLPEDVRPAELLAARRFRPGWEELLQGGWRRFTKRQWSLLSDLYDAEVATLDSELAKFVSALREEGVLDETVLVIVSDHGENLGDHGLCAHIWSLHRSLLHIPMLIRYPPRFEEGARVGTVVRLEDLFPTILTLCGAPVPDGLDGESLLELGGDRPARAALGGEVDDRTRENFPEFVRSGIWRPRRSAYDGRFHLIERADGPEELYDVGSDPAETRNLATEKPEVTERLRELLPDVFWKR